MKSLHRALPWLALLCLVLAGGVAAAAQTSGGAYEPRPGQEGKDAVWVPTPSSLVEYMLDVAHVTPRDFVIDLGSGDGRNVIAAARRGARALGVEYNPDLVAVATRAAAAAGVSGKARFVQGDMFEADISQATVLALFLLPDNLRRLTPKFAELRPGTRIVVNTFGIVGWQPEQEVRMEGDCGSWCTVLLYLVPAKVEGAWRTPQGMLTLEQRFQTFTGTLESNGASTAIDNGHLSGDRISFAVGGVQYSGRVNGNTMSGLVKGGSATRWSAARVRQ